MQQRTITGIFFLIFLVGGIYLGPIGFAILFSFISLAGLAEFYRLVRFGHVYPNAPLGMVLAVLILAYGFGTKLFGLHLTNTLPIMAVVFFMAIFLLAELYRDLKYPMNNIAITIFGVGYVVLPFVFLAAIGSDGIGNYNPNRLVALYALFWANDVGAYLIGKSLGRHKLYERVSPKKTWEGFIGGGIIAVVSGYFLAFYTNLFSLEQGLVCGGIAAVFGTFGDLVESALKRSVNVKDSGSLLPGHGGILDRFDSQIFTFPILYLYLNILSNP